MRRLAADYLRRNLVNSCISTIPPASLSAAVLHFSCNDGCIGTAAMLPHSSMWSTVSSFSEPSEDVDIDDDDNEDEIDYNEESKTIRHCRRPRSRGDGTCSTSGSLA